MIYVHVPFCRSFCTYCDFYSIIAGNCSGKPVPEGIPTFSAENVGNPRQRPGVTDKKGLFCRDASREAEAFEKYTDDLCAEICARREEIAASDGVRTLYFGGGTPSLLPPDCLGRIVECLDAGPYDEFTVEVNPEDIVEKGTSYVEGLLSLGVNRISMGVQSLDDGMLRWMNRRHNADGAREAFRIISESTPAARWQPSQTVSPAARPHRSLRSRSPLSCCRGWHRFAEGSSGRPASIDRSVDIIFGVPGMDCGMLGATVKEILTWRPEHISAYQLSIEEGSALAKMIAGGKVSEAPEEECRAQYDLLCRMLKEAGYHHYEISNWALPGHEAIHNSAYWTRQPYVGLGPGAHCLTFLDKKGCPVRPDAAGRQYAPSGSSEGEMQAFAGCLPPGTIQRRSWNSREPFGWKAEGGEVLGAEEIREEELMLLARTDRGPIPERDWFIADSLIAGMI